MKFIPTLTLALLILFTISTDAQINSGIGYMHGTDNKGDTIQDYQDKPQMHSHEQVTIIKEKQLTPAEARKAGVNVPPNTQHQGGRAAIDTTAASPDTTAQAASAPADTTTTPTLTANTLILSSACDCINMSFIYYALGFFAFAFLLSVYLFILLLRDQKRPPFIAALHAILVTMGMTLFSVYCIFQPFPMACLILLVLAALSSLGLLYYDVTGQKAPKGLAIIHGALALIGVILLLVFTFGH